VRRIPTDEEVAEAMDRIFGGRDPADNPYRSAGREPPSDRDLEEAAEKLWAAPNPYARGGPHDAETRRERLRERERKYVEHIGRLRRGERVDGPDPEALDRALSEAYWRLFS